jgi:hypothetical protein
VALDSNAQLTPPLQSPNLPSPYVCLKNFKSARLRFDYHIFEDELDKTQQAIPEACTSVGERRTLSEARQTISMRHRKSLYDLPSASPPVVLKAPRRSKLSPAAQAAIEQKKCWKRGLH